MDPKTGRDHPSFWDLDLKELEVYVHAYMAILNEPIALSRSQWDLFLKSVQHIHPGPTEKRNAPNMAVFGSSNFSKPGLANTLVGMFGTTVVLQDEEE